MLLSVCVVSRYVLTNRQTIKACDSFEKSYLVFQRQMSIPALREYISRKVDVEQAAYMAVDAQEFDQHLGTLHTVNTIRIDKLRNERRKSERGVETTALQFFHSRDTPRRRDCLLYTSPSPRD